MVLIYILFYYFLLRFIDRHAFFVTALYVAKHTKGYKQAQQYKEYRRRT